MPIRILGCVMFILLSGCGTTSAGPGLARPVSAQMAKSETPEIGQKILQAGLKYLGTPYVFGSDRADKTTMDCSEFVRWAYIEGANVTLPGNSRTQAQWVKDNGNFKTDWRQLRPGELMFFCSSKGKNKSDYDGIDLQQERISHVALYMGDGMMLHTYSPKAGGVRTDRFEDSVWSYRFVGGGSGLKPASLQHR